MGSEVTKAPRGNGKISPAHTPSPAQPSVPPGLVLRCCCRPGKAGLCSVIESSIRVSNASKALAADGPLYEPSAHCPAGIISLPAAKAGLDFLGWLPLLSAQHISFVAACARPAALNEHCYSGAGPSWARALVSAGTGPWLSSSTRLASDAKQTCDCLHACFLLFLGFLLSYCNIINMQ